MYEKEMLYIQIDALSRLVGQISMNKVKKSISKKKYPVGWEVKEMKLFRDKLTRERGHDKQKYSQAV